MACSITWAWLACQRISAKHSNYSNSPQIEAILPKQFDAWVWFDETGAVTPLRGEARPGEPHVLTGGEETYPFGL